MKDKLWIYIIIIMLTVLSPINIDFSWAEPADSDYVKVGLKYSSGAVTTVNLKSDQGFLFGTASNRSFQETMPLPAYTNLVVANVNGYIEVRDSSGTLISADLGSSNCIMPYDYSSNGIIYFESNPYRGGIIFKANSNGTLNVINYICMDHYLYGVLNSEIGRLNPKEALKAQAIAARSFAELKLNTHKDYGFDLCTTTHCQVYKGYAGEYTETSTAVDETKGLKIYNNNSIVSAFYFKNSGGYTQNIEDVWTDSSSYLKAVKDNYSPEYKWTASLTFEEIKSKLEQAGYNPGTINSVVIKNRNSNGSVSELEFCGSKENITLKKEKIRTVLGATTVKSLLFEMGNSSTESAGTSWKISNGFNTNAVNAELYVVSRGGSVTKVAKDNIYGFNGFVTSALSKLGTGANTSTSGTLYLLGKGYGHGVGMPQDSAIEMAKQGFTFDQILKYYYTGIDIK